MYGALRNRAYNSSQLAGLSAAVLVTAAFGYALANGFAMDLARIVEQPITFTPMIDDSIPDQPENRDLPLLDALPLPVPAPLAPDDVFKTDDVIITAPPASEGAPIAKLGSAPAPKPARTRPVLLPQAPPPYPPPAVRHNEQGISRLEVCVDAKGRVSAASIVASSGSEALDDASLKWVRSARFTPGKRDGAPQSVCGHTIAYEWKLEDASR